MTRPGVPLAMLVLLPAAVALDAQAEVKSASSDGFVIVHSRRIDATPARVYAGLPAIDRWWSDEHTYSGSAANLTLRPEAGGCFCERWKDGEVEHGRVIMVIRDQVLRLQTALGPLQARAVSGVLNFQLKPDETTNGKATLLTVTYTVNAASASALDKSAPTVDGVIAGQLDRLVRYIETGKAATP